MEAVPLLKERLYVVCSEKHPLSNCTSIHLNELLPYQAVIYSRNYKLGRKCSSILEEYGISYFETDNSPNMFRRCQNSFVVGMPPIFKGSSYKRFNCVAIPLEEKIFWTNALITRKGVLLNQKEREIVALIQKELLYE